MYWPDQAKLDWAFFQNFCVFLVMPLLTAIYCCCWISYVCNNSSRIYRISLYNMYGSTNLAIMNSWDNLGLAPVLSSRVVTCEILGSSAHHFRLLIISYQLNQLKSFYNGRKVSKSITALSESVLTACQTVAEKLDLLWQEILRCRFLFILVIIIAIC